MPIKTFAPGVLTSSDVNTYLMNQAVITCTSTTRPASPSEGMTIYETDTDQYLTYTGAAWRTSLNSGAWTSYTPTLGGGAALGGGSTSARYARIGSGVVTTGRIIFGAAGAWATAGNAFTVDIPAGIAISSALLSSFMGQCSMVDVSTGTYYAGWLQQQSTTTLGIAWLTDAITPAIGLRPANATTPPFAIQVNDEIHWHATWESA